MGKIISFEGIDGSGKTTALGIFQEILRNTGIEILSISEPGGTSVGNLVRQITSTTDAYHHPWVDALLFMAARIDNIHSIVKPAISSGKWILFDRFVDSTFAYQGYGQGLKLEHLEKIYSYAGENLFPHLTVLMDCPVEVAWSRIAKRGRKKDRWEKLGFEFFEKVREGYLHLAEKYSDRFIIVNSKKSLEEIKLIFEDTIHSLKHGKKDEHKF